MKSQLAPLACSSDAESLSLCGHDDAGACCRGLRPLCCAGVIFVAEHFWQPFKPRYLRSFPLVILGLLTFWPLRLVMAWIETREALPHRFMAVPSDGREQRRFPRLDDAIVWVIAFVTRPSPAYCRSRGPHSLVHQRSYLPHLWARG
jgi:hypothetical protein